LETNFGAEARFDNQRAVQIRLLGFDLDSLIEVGQKIRDIYADGSNSAAQIRSLADDDYLRDLGWPMF
jgi:hypothetical protein